MTTHVLISFFCDDRPGVTEQLSAAVESCGGNWLESRLSRLGGQFAGVIQVQLAEQARDSLEQALTALREDNITALVTTSSQGPVVNAELRKISLLGPDRVGIVHELTRALVSGGFNLLSLDTSVESAPMSGEPLFRARATIEVREGSRLDELEWQLDALAESMTLEIDLLPVDSIDDQRLAS